MDKDDYMDAIDYIDTCDPYSDYIEFDSDSGGEFVGCDAFGNEFRRVDGDAILAHEEMVELIEAIQANGGN